MTSRLHPLRLLCAAVLLIAYSSHGLSACAGAAASQRFVISKSGSAVLDCRTGYIWFRCTVGQEWNAAAKTCTGIPYRATRLDLLGYAGEVRRNGYRLPTQQQLRDLLETGAGIPMIDRVAFPDTPPGSFWTQEGAAAYRTGMLIPPYLIDFSGGAAKEDQMSVGTGFYLRYMLIPGSREALAAGFPAPPVKSE